MFDLTKGGTAYPASWYAHDAQGNRVQSPYGNYLLDPSNQAWDTEVAHQCTEIIAQSGYDGCFLDTLGTAPLDPAYVTGLPINPSTGQVWTIPQWIAATSAVARTAQDSNPNAIVMVNGLANGQKYYNSGGSTEPLIAATQVGMVELWLRSDATPVNTFKPVSAWLQDLNMLVDAQSKGYSIATVTKLWVTATQAQVNQWHKYALATFLLAANGHSYFCFTTAATTTGLVSNTAWDDVNIGTPTGAYTQVGNVYERQFSNGRVVVNPNSTPETVSFGGTYSNLNGKQVSVETLPPDSGDVLTG
jgi:hypothetical protein